MGLSLIAGARRAARAGARATLPLVVAARIDRQNTLPYVVVAVVTVGVVVRVRVAAEPRRPRAHGVDDLVDHGGDGLGLVQVRGVFYGVGDDDLRRPCSARRSRFSMDFAALERQRHPLRARSNG